MRSLTVARQVDDVGSPVDVTNHITFLDHVR